jgi:NifU-like protein involved in Fe-S cluster formation
MNEDKIMDHWQSPVGKGLGRFAPTHSGFAENPGCGDTIRIDIRMVDGKMECVAFDGKGCVLSQAGGSMLAEWLAYNPQCIDLVLGMDKIFVQESRMKFVEALYGGRPIPVRWGCCLLPLKALLNAEPVAVVE